MRLDQIYTLHSLVSIRRTCSTEAMLFVDRSLIQYLTEDSLQVSRMIRGYYSASLSTICEEFQLIPFVTTMSFIGYAARALLLPGPEMSFVSWTSSSL